MICVNFMFALSLSSCIIQTLKANGGRVLPSEDPGKKWWGDGINLSRDDNWTMLGGSFVDGMAKAAYPYLLTSLLNLTTLGQQSNIHGWPNYIIFATSEGYLCCFLFSLICICESIEELFSMHLLHLP